MEYNFPPPFNSVPLIPVSEENEECRASSNVTNAFVHFGGAHLTDFTKRKNWPLRVLGELKDFLHVVSPTGKFLFCSPSCREMVGFFPEELVGRNVTEFIHVDDRDSFIRDFNLAITQKSFQLFYRFRKKDDKFILLEAKGHPYFSEGSTTARCFFLMSRPYPSKAAAMMDSFLELRMENEVLTRKLQDLKRDVEDQNTHNETTSQPMMQINPQTKTQNDPEPIIPHSISSKTPISVPLSHTNDSEARIRKAKKPKAEDEIHVCTDCGTVESPEWRRGPQGPKTLCNACGLRYAKRSRKTKDSSQMEEVR